MRERRERPSGAVRLAMLSDGLFDAAFVEDAIHVGIGYARNKDRAADLCGDDRRSPSGRSQPGTD